MAGVVTIGSRIQIRDGDEELEFCIVGPEEADAGAGRISSECPLGRALLGRAVGEWVRVSSPDGLRTVSVLEAS